MIVADAARVETRNRANEHTHTDCIKRDYDNTVLVLQGGGALGAYQAGVYEGLAEASYAPDWVTGLSIGAINAALIAGNPPELRVERLREFSNLVSSGLLANAPRVLEGMRRVFNRASCSTARAESTVPMEAGTAAGFTADGRTGPTSQNWARALLHSERWRTDSARSDPYPAPQGKW